MTHSLLRRRDRHPSSAAGREAPAGPTVAAVSLAALLVVGQLYATLPLISDLAGRFEVSSGTAAWAATAFGFAYAVGMLVAGPVSDVVGRRRVAVAALLAAAVATLLVATSSSYAVLLTTRAIQGVAAAFFPSVALAYLTERIAPHRRSTALTTVISAFLAAAIVAPLAALALSALGGWRTWFYISAAGLVSMAAVLWQVMLSDSATTRAGTGAVRRVGAQLIELPKLLVLPRLVGLYVVTSSVMFTFVGVTTLAQLAAPGITGHDGVMQAVRAATLPACVIVPLAAPLLSRLRGTRRLAGAIALSGLAAAATAAATGAATLALALGCLTVGVAVTAPALVETIGETSPPAQRGAAAAIYGFALFVGASLAAPVATAAAAHPYSIGAVGFAAISGLSVVIVKWSTRQ